MSKGTKERTLKAQVRVNCDRRTSFTNREFVSNLNFSCTKTTKLSKKKRRSLLVQLKDLKFCKLKVLKLKILKDKL